MAKLAPFHDKKVSHVLICSEAVFSKKVPILED